MKKFNVTSPFSGHVSTVRGVGQTKNALRYFGVGEFGMHDAYHNMEIGEIRDLPAHLKSSGRIIRVKIERIA